MPAGVVSLTMHTDHDSITLTPVTYYTNMGEVSRCLENATDPVNFICQVRHDECVALLVAVFVSLNCSSIYATFIYLLFYFQAFNLSSDATESVDSMLSESLKEKMPATSLQLFGIKQIEEENMSACECSRLISDCLLGEHVDPQSCTCITRIASLQCLCDLLQYNYRK